MQYLLGKTRIAYVKVLNYDTTLSYKIDVMHIMKNVALPHTLLTLILRKPEDIVVTRQRVRQIMSLLGFSKPASTQMITAVSEIARNACQYTDGGKATILLNLSDNNLIYFSVNIEDKGRGIAELESILQGKYKTKRGEVFGIVGSQRIVDLFSIKTSTEGTFVSLSMQIPAKLTIDHLMLSQIANELAQHRPKSANEEIEQQNQELLVALDMLTKARDELDYKVQERTKNLANANAALQQTTEQLHLALHSAKAGTWHWQKFDDSLRWDTYTCTLLGLEVGCVFNTNKAFINCLHPDDAPDRKQKLSKFFMSACSNGGKEFRILRPDGQLRYILARGTGYYDNSQKIQRMSGIFWDITERKQAEKDLQLYQAQAAQAQRINSMGEMASALAHEINQPLAAISAFTRGCLRRLESGKQTPKQLKEILTAVAEQSERAGEVVHRIKNFARKGELYNEEVDVKTLLHTVVKLIDAEINRHQVKIQIKTFNKPLLIYIDKIQIEQVILNLIRNSVEAMQAANTVNPTIKLQACLLNKDNINISVSDNGPGFPQQIATKLFEAYFSTKPSGMGMGLAICRTIIEAHEGKLSASTTSQGGACFECILPLRN